MKASGPGVYVVAENVTATLRGKKSSGKVLLDKVDFLAEPGKMTAIMGPSGSGKTTFLNALAGRLGKTAKVEGDICYGGHSDAISKVNQFVAYVMQEDYFLEYLTVEETLYFAARLRLRGMPRKDQTRRADLVLAELGLDGCRQVLVGGRSVKGVSGGQRKRVSIAVALLSEPAILYLDEPTSGLDSSLAFDVVKTLQQVAKNSQRTVVCTIHQPRSQVYALFDALLLLRSGRPVYYGTTMGATQYFASLGHVCPDDFNPPDFFLDLLTTDGESAAAKAGGDDAQRGSVQRVVVSTEIADKFAVDFEQSEAAEKARLQRKEARTIIQELKTNGAEDNAVVKWLSSVWTLTMRGAVCNRRQPKFLYVNLASAAFMTVLLGTIWWQVKFPNLDSPECDVPTTRNLLGGILQLVGFNGFSCFDAGISFIGRRPLMNRESSSGLYTHSAALTANYISDGFFHYWPNLMVAICLYWMVGYDKSTAKFFIWILAAALLKFTYWGYSTWCGAMAPSVPAVSGMIPLGSVLLFMTSGFQLSDAEIPKWLTWLKSISPPRYIMQALSRVQLNDEYLERCMNFETPPGWIRGFCYTLGVAAAFRVLSYISFQFMNTRQGTQA